MDKFQKDCLKEIETALQELYCLKFYKMDSNMHNENLNSIKFMKNKITQIFNKGV